MPSINKPVVCIIIVMFLSGSINAQRLLNKTVSIEAQKVPLSELLKRIGKQGGFYFSFNSNLTPADSLVSISVHNKTIKYTLDLLFQGTVQYKETSGYIILQQADAAPYWYISGYVKDGASGEKLSNVSIYERTHLMGTTTDDRGYFRIQLKERSKYPPIINISVSCVSYEDTTFQVSTGYNLELGVTITPSDNSLETVIVIPKVEKLRVAKLLISSRLKNQTANLRNFLATKPFQFSLTPGIGTHGQFGAQVVNKFSFNLLGGYSAGVNGFELAGLFNITKEEVRKVQIAGLFNVVGGYVEGVQIAGLHNKVLDSVRGVQIGGIVNVVRDNLSGLQVSGIVSSISGSLDGLVISGISSTVGKNVDGLQLSGITNINKGIMNGMQLSGIYNYTRHLKGAQLGLINVADTSEGYSIGLLNINKRGFHRFSLYANNLSDVNLAYKAGNRKFYCMLLGSFNVLKDKSFGVGYGLGSEFTLYKRISSISELTTEAFYIGSWKKLPFTSTLSTSIGYNIHKSFQLFAGTSLSIGWENTVPTKGYAPATPDHTTFSLGRNKGWIGWQAGVIFK